MLAELVHRAKIFRVLRRIDDDLAELERKKRCRHCGGRLDRGDYMRKPRGGPKLLEAYELRRSFCCASRSCRKRRKPPSVLFWGQRVYWGCVIVVVMALRQDGGDVPSTKRLMRMFGVSRNTIKRWAAYFRKEFPRSGQWQRIRGRVCSWVRDGDLPGGLLRLFTAHSSSAEDGLVGCLKLLSVGQA